MRRFISALLITFALATSTAAAQAILDKTEETPTTNLKPAAAQRVNFAADSIRDRLILHTEGLPQLEVGELRDLVPPPYDD